VRIEATLISESAMDLPVKFPSETEVILEDVARFRALSPMDQVRTIHDLLASGMRLMKRSPMAAWIQEESDEQWRLERQNILEFIARHAQSPAAILEHCPPFPGCTREPRE
jgi:hypothetical protein